MHNFRDEKYWALVLGGSSGFGLATAKKLASMGFSICIAHRDRRASIERIQKEFHEIEKEAPQFISLNIDALSEEGRTKIIDTLNEKLNEKTNGDNNEKTNGSAKVRVLMHSIAFGNLKLIAPEPKEAPAGPVKKIADTLNISEEKLKSTVDTMFISGEDALSAIAEPPRYNNEIFISDEDMENTIYSMGSSLLTYTQELYHRGLFAPDARVLGMTSEGNAIAWKGYAAVSAAKAVLESIARSIAVEFAPYGIRCNIIQAGVTNTPALQLIPGSAHLIAHSRKRNPFKRLTKTEDVANVIGLLATDEAAWINGEIIRVDGGEHISGL